MVGKAVDGKGYANDDHRDGPELPPIETEDLKYDDVLGGTV